jgi:hypothetical protein
MLGQLSTNIRERHEEGRSAGLGRQCGVDAGRLDHRVVGGLRAQRGVG